MVYETSRHRHVRIGRLDYTSCFIYALVFTSKATVYVSGVRLHHVISYHIEHTMSHRGVNLTAVHISRDVLIVIHIRPTSFPRKLTGVHFAVLVSGIKMLCGLFLRRITLTIPDYFNGYMCTGIYNIFNNWRNLK